MATIPDLTCVSFCSIGDYPVLIKIFEYSVAKTDFHTILMTIRIFRLLPGRENYTTPACIAHPFSADGQSPAHNTPITKH
jgi:hypothetical protein